MLRKSEQSQDWCKRLAIYGGAKSNRPATDINNFSLTLEEKYLIELQNGLNKIYRLTFSKNRNQLGKLFNFYHELLIDIALDAIDPDWYEQQKEKLNQKYQIDDSLKWKNRKERIKERDKQIELRQTRIKTLHIGQVIDGTVVGLRPYGVFVDIGGIHTLLHISKISRSPVEDPQKVFELNDWVRAIVVYVNREKGRIGLSTKDLESEPGKMFTEPWAVYQNAEAMAKKYKKTISNGSS